MQPWRKGTKQGARSGATGSGAEHGRLEQPISTDAAIAALMYRGQEQRAQAIAARPFASAAISSARCSPCSPQPATAL